MKLMVINRRGAVRASEAGVRGTLGSMVSDRCLREQGIICDECGI